MLSLEPNVVRRHTFVEQLYSKMDSEHVQALRRSMSIKGSPESLKTGNKQTQFSLDQSMLFKRMSLIGKLKNCTVIDDVKREVML